MITVVIITIAYLVGAIPFGYLIARVRGTDILREGSGNIGATNVGRILGRPYGVLVFCLDFAKGAGPVVAVRWLASGEGNGNRSSVDPEILAAAAGLAAFIGHLYPIYLGFRGGKGVATGAGVMACLVPGPALSALMTWFVVLCSTRYVSLASLTAALVLVLLRLTTVGLSLSPPDNIVTLICLVASGLICLRHRSNILRLLSGTENRIGEGPTTRQLIKSIHIMAIGLWFGTAVFFQISAIVIFHTFEKLATSQRPAWMPLPGEMTREQGSQLAGLAIGPLFDWYFGIQAIGSLLALATSVSWLKETKHHNIHRLRVLILSFAFATIIIGWPLARHISVLRLMRYGTDSTMAAAAKAAFGSWHTYSLLLSLITLILVSFATVLAARLPAGDPEPKPNA